jgi:hypothetical protein
MSFKNYYIKEITKRSIPSDFLAVSKGFETGKPIRFNFMRNTESSKNFTTNQDFQQKIEPSGQYMSLDTMPSLDPLPNWEKGMQTFNNPIVLKFNTGGNDVYDDNSWKMNLYKIYKKKGMALSRALVSDGYDGIVTIDREGDILEIIKIK